MWRVARWKELQFLRSLRLECTSRQRAKRQWHWGFPVKGGQADLPTHPRCLRRDTYSDEICNKQTTNDSYITDSVGARTINLLSIVVTEALRVAASVTSWSCLASICPSKQSECWHTHPILIYTADMALLSLCSALTVCQSLDKTYGPWTDSIATKIHVIVTSDNAFPWHGHTTSTTTATVILMLRND